MVIKFHVQLILPVSGAQAHLRNALTTKRIRLGEGLATQMCEETEKAPSDTRADSDTLGVCKCYSNTMDPSDNVSEQTTTDAAQRVHAIKQQQQLVAKWPPPRFGVLLSEADIVITQLWATPLKVCIEVITGVVGATVVTGIVLSQDNGMNAVIAGVLLYLVALSSVVLAILCRKLRVRLLTKYYNERRRRVQTYQSMVELALTYDAHKIHSRRPSNLRHTVLDELESESNTVLERERAALSVSDSRTCRLRRLSVTGRSTGERFSLSEPHLPSTTSSTVTVEVSKQLPSESTLKAIETSSSRSPADDLRVTQTAPQGVSYQEGLLEPDNLLLDTHRAITLSSVANRRMTLLNVAWTLNARLFLYFCFLLLVIVLVIVFDRVNLNVASAVALTGLTVLLLSYANNLMDAFQELPLGYAILLDLAEIFNTPVSEGRDHDIAHRT